MKSGDQVQAQLKQDKEALNKVIEVVTEMLKTELTYKASLDQLDQALKNVSSKNPIFKELAEQLAGLQTISIQLHTNLTQYLELNASVPEYDTFEKRTLNQQRLELLKSFYFVYKRYNLIFEKYIAQNQKSPSKFTALDKYIKEHSPNQYGLADILIQPVQRGPRYRLLVESAIKYDDDLDAGHPHKLAPENRKLLEEALDTINEALRDANNALQEAKKIDNAREEAKKIDAAPKEPPKIDVAPEEAKEVAQGDYYPGKYTMEYVMPGLAQAGGFLIDKFYGSPEQEKMAIEIKRQDENTHQSSPATAQVEMKEQTTTEVAKEEAKTSPKHSRLLTYAGSFFMRQQTAEKPAAKPEETAKKESVFEHEDIEDGFTVLNEKKGPQ